MLHKLGSTLLPLLLVLLMLSSCGSEQKDVPATALPTVSATNRFPSEDEYFNKQNLAEEYSLPLLQHYEDAHNQYQDLLDQVMNDPAQATDEQWQAAFDEVQKYLRYVHLQFSRPDEYEDIKIFSSFASYSEDTAQGFRELTFGMQYAEQAMVFTELYIQTGQTDVSTAWLAWQNFEAANSHLQLGEPALNLVSSKLDFQFYTAADLLKTVASQGESPPPEIKLLHIDYAGAAESSEADERIVIANTKNVPVNLGGWRIEAEKSGREYTFPKVTIEPYGSIQIYTNNDDSESGGFVFGLEYPVWSSEGDCGLLYDQQGTLASKLCYSSQGISNGGSLASPISWTFGLGDSRPQLFPNEVARLGDGILYESELIPDGSGVLVRTSLAVWYIPLTGSMTLELVDDTTAYRSMALAHDNSTLALGDATGRLIIKRVPSIETVAIRDGNEDYIRYLIWSPDDRYLAAVSLLGSVRVWDSQTWDAVFAADNDVDYVTWSPNGQYLAAAGAEGIVQVWQTESWLTRYRSDDDFPAPAARYDTRLVWSEDSQFIAVARATTVAVISLWFQSEFSVFATQDESNEIKSIAFSPDRNYLALGLEDGSIPVIDGSTWQLAMSLVGHKDAIRSIRWSSDGRLLFSSADDRTERAWDIQKEAVVEVKDADNWNFAPQAIDSGVAVIHTDDNRVRVERVSDGTILKETGAFNSFEIASLSENGSILTIVEDMNQVHLTSAELEQALGQLNLDSEWYEEIAASPDGRLLAASTTFDPPTLLDTQTGEKLLTFTGATKWINTIAWSPDSRLVAFASRDNSIGLWDASTGQQLRSFEGIEQNAADLEFSPDGTYLAAGFLGKLARIWRVDNGAIVKDLTDVRLPVISVSWSPDSTKLLIGSWDGTIHLYDLQADRSSLVARYGVWVWVAAWSPNGDEVAVGREDGIIDILSAETWEIIESFTGHRGVIRRVVWASDHRLLSSGDDGTVRLWSANRVR